MKVDPETEFAQGITNRQLRDYLKRSGDYVSPAGLADEFGKSKTATRELIAALISDGYLDELDEQGWHPVGQKGMQLANAKFIKRMSRAQATELLNGLIDRANEINRRPELTHYVVELHVFGSYVSSAEDLGDLDVAVKLEPKNENGKDIVQRSKERARASGRNLPFFQILAFGEQEVMQLLKARKARISLHPLSDLNLPDVQSERVFSRTSEAAGN